MKKYECIKCGKKLRTLNGLKQHLSRVHGCTFYVSYLKEPQPLDGKVRYVELSALEEQSHLHPNPVAVEKVLLYDEVKDATKGLMEELRAGLLDKKEVQNASDDTLFVASSFVRYLIKKWLKDVVE